MFNAINGDAARGLWRCRACATSSLPVPDSPLISRLIEECVRRPGDRVARYGGEEIAVVLPNTDEAGARAVAETIRQTIESAGLPHLGSPFGIITVSLGVATWVAQDEPCDPSQLIELADQALYSAKAQGRNRTHTFAHPPIHAL